MGVTFHPLEQPQIRSPATIACTSLAHGFRTTNQLALALRVVGQHPINMAAKRDVAALLNV